MSIEKVISSMPSKSHQELQQMRSNAQRAAARGLDDAHQLIVAIDRHEAAKRDRLASRASNLPRAELVRKAFMAKPMTETERKIVKVLLDNPGSTSEGLSKALGWGVQSWHMHFGTMCEKRLHSLWPPSPSDRRDADFYSGILADLSPGTNRWTIKPEVAEGFAALGLRPS